MKLCRALAVMLLVCVMSVSVLAGVPEMPPAPAAIPEPKTTTTQPAAIRAAEETGEEASADAMDVLAAVLTSLLSAL